MYADNLSCTQYLHHVQTTEQKLTVTEGVIKSVIDLSFKTQTPCILNT